MSTFRERLAQGNHLVGCFLNTGSSLAAEICATAGFDWLLIDLEHGSGTEADLLPQLQAIAGTGATPLVRVEANERPRFTTALDLGADGVMVPRVDSVEDARRAVSYVRYPPAGIRGVALLNRAARFGADGRSAIESFNDRGVCIVQIESPQAVAESNAIAALDGVDCLFVGPADLSHALGTFLAFDDPRFVEAVETVRAAAAAHGKTAGVLVRTAEEHEWYHEHGFTLIGIGSDSSFLANAARAAARGVASE